MKIAHITLIICLTIISGCLVPPSTCSDFESKSFWGTWYNVEDNGSDRNIVLVHGGGWREGDKNTPIFYNRSLKAKQVLSQFNIYSLNYPLWDNHRDINGHPIQANTVIAFLESLPGKSILIGHSAGAHIAASVTSMRPDLVSGLITYSGIYNFDEAFLSNYPDQITPDIRNYKEDSAFDPTVSDIAVPALLLSSQADLVVNYNQTLQFAQKIGSTPIIYEDTRHYEHLFGECDADSDTTLTEDILAFIELL